VNQQDQDASEPTEAFWRRPSETTDVLIIADDISALRGYQERHRDGSLLEVDGNGSRVFQGLLG
jgi:hypothetical protein